MNCNKYPGSRWWRFDFHTHTPESRDYGRGEQVEISKREWLLQHMRAGLQCVAVTDHNTGGWVDGLAAELETLRREAEEGNPAEGYAPLFLFPGVEISVSGDLHLLALFPPDTNGQHIANIVHECGYWGTPGDSDAVTSRSIFDTVDCVLRNGGIPIPAHADGPKGLFVVERPSDVKGLAEKPVDSMELLDPAFTPPQVYRELKLEWTVVQGSDSHRPREVGRRFSWVKMGDPPTFEGLKLALWDGAGSVLAGDLHPDDPNRHGSHWIRALTVSNATYLGRDQPREFQFSPWLNTLVGGRGTGKSTVIEFLRLALRRTDELDGSDLLRNQKKYWQVQKSRREPGALLPTTTIQVDYCRDGGILRSNYAEARASTTPSLEEVDTLGASRSVPGDIRDRCPARIFSQNQIFELSVQPQGLLRVIDDSTRVARHDWSARWNEEEATFLRLRAQGRETQARAQELETLEGRLQDIVRRQALFEQQGSAEILQKFNRKRRQRALLESRLQFVEEAAERAMGVAGSLEVPSVPAAEFPADSAGDFAAWQALQQSDGELADLQQALRQATERLQAHAQEWRDFLANSAWSDEEDADLQAFRGFQAALQTPPGQAPPDYGKIVAERQTLERRIQELLAQRKLAEDYRNQANKIYGKLVVQRQALTTRRRQFLEEVLRDNHLIRIRVVPYGDQDGAEEQLRELLQIRPEAYRDETSGWISELYQDYPDSVEPAELERRVLEFKKRLLGAVSGQAVSPPIPGRLLTTLRGLQSRPEIGDRLVTWFPEDRLEVDHMSDGKPRPFDASSPGERAAGILAFILAHGDEPLLLDQPENDLDNQIIYGLVAEQIRESKKRRQVIVVTHNPNLVVHADAELVIVMNKHKGQVRPSVSGSLQEKDVRAAVCEVMEGGRKALQERYHRLIEVDGDV